MTVYYLITIFTNKQKDKIMIDSDYKYFEKVRKKMFLEHPNEFVLIKDKKRIGFFHTMKDALSVASKNFELGSFLVKQCIKKDTDIHRYHSNIIFS